MLILGTTTCMNGTLEVNDIVLGITPSLGNTLTLAPTVGTVVEIFEGSKIFPPNTHEVVVKFRNSHLLRVWSGALIKVDLQPLSFGVHKLETDPTYRLVKYTELVRAAGTNTPTTNSDIHPIPNQSSPQALDLLSNPITKGSYAILFNTAPFDQLNGQIISVVAIWRDTSNVSNYILGAFPHGNTNMAQPSNIMYISPDTVITIPAILVEELSSERTVAVKYCIDTIATYVRAMNSNT